jgi:hypothetical protein
MDCQGLADVSFDTGSRMRRLDSRLCYGSALSSVIPGKVELIELIQRVQEELDDSTDHPKDR